MPVLFRRLPSGTILVDVAEPAGELRAVPYAWVSSDEQRADLDRQVSRLTDWATATGFQVGQVVAGSGAGSAASAQHWPVFCRTLLSV